MKTLTILKRARKLLTNPKRWCQGRFAKDKWGNGCNVNDERAYQFCIAGAVEHVSGGVDYDPGSEYQEAIDILNRSVRGGSTIVFNDMPKRKHAQVLAAFDKAIVRAEKAELAAKKGAAK